MLIRDIQTNKIIVPTNRLSEYIKFKLELFKWKDKELVERSKLSPSEISKLKNGLRQGLTAKIFYSLYTTFEDSCEEAMTFIYPDLNLSLGEYKDSDRNTFGKYMSTYEVIQNSIEIIAAKTGIDLQRLKDLYYRKGSLEAYELILIERALGKNMGEIFEEWFK